MKKKIGIITITDYLNYGNRLQNYATQIVLQSLGFYVISIKNSTGNIIPKIKTSLSESAFRILKQSPFILISKALKKIKRKIGEKKEIQLLLKKEKSFIDFSKNYISETDFVITPDNIPFNIAESFDFFVVGSDQVWNPHFRFGNSMDFLSFAPKEKRITFAPSFGVSGIPDVYKESFKKGLNGFDNISIREKSGAEIIKELTGKEASVLIDPTLMLNNQEWLKISNKARFIPEGPYLLTYYIGEVSSTRKKILKNISVQLNLELIMLNSKDDEQRFDADPGEFIDYFNSATLICTDSFHAIIFSILFKKPFLVFEREGNSAPMSSRIENLLEKFKLSDRKYNIQTDYNKLLEIEFNQIDDILKTERVKVIEFLTNSFNKKL